MLEFLRDSPDVDGDCLYELTLEICKHLFDCALNGTTARINQKACQLLLVFLTSSSQRLVDQMFDESEEMI